MVVGSATALAQRLDERGGVVVPGPATDRRAVGVDHHVGRVALDQELLGQFGPLALLRVQVVEDHCGQGLLQTADSRPPHGRTRVQVPHHSVKKSSRTGTPRTAAWAWASASVPGGAWSTSPQPAAARQQRQGEPGRNEADRLIGRPLAGSGAVRRNEKRTASMKHKTGIRASDGPVRSGPRPTGLPAPENLNSHMRRPKRK